ncbi:MAG: D-alanyl-D-alanine carboxypeptidase [Clostridiales bacterium]|jgi:D-alanyl-D-alanine carboxypeptidase (penicillin-binding protein 5/6)|nr:D-alanyl-D-alanine carboxypeptidase [Clostridiales bacterium]HOA33526.1 D-alanyl-D-alanine carboxypeptidase family protein [Clostridiales bacterium]HOJ35297.1 D-alanyl-D-alanine carboxypeptidase family protein [Clostridiales bacterium]HOL78931.1 D-alanyl-D-alanine carboxypeptidase family protein [Clostridiales bacterium]HPP68417.1 D-alanyl-D-alanine carboxypeptidase family protein [Clostridiales bacterium]
MRKFLISALVCLIILTTSVNALASYNSEIDVEAEIVFLQSMDDGTVIFDKNADMLTAPASLAKIVTASIVLENAQNLDEIVEVPNYAIRLLDGTNSSTAGLLPGEQMSVRNLLYCMLVASANDAANVLADYICPNNIGAFVQMMNEYVKSIGCENTVFINPSGLDAEGQYTTARDVAKFTLKALENPIFEEITSTKKYTIPPTNKYPQERNLISTVKIMNSGIKDYYIPTAKGIKTGTTSNAGRCIVTKASKDGYTYLAVVMRAPFYDIDNDGVEENIAFMECKKILDWTFKNIKLRLVAEKNQVVSVIDVGLSSKYDHLRLLPEKEITALVPSGVNAQGVYFEVIEELTPKKVDAPIKKGQKIGRARILYAGNEIAQVDLVAGETIERNFLLYLAKITKTVLTSPVFIILAAILAAAVVVILILRAKNSRRKTVIRVVKDYSALKRR